MIEGSIKFAGSVDYDNDCAFDITVSRETIEFHTHFYGDDATWSDFGERLMNFPESKSARVSIQIDVEAYAGFLFLEAYCYDNQGHAAIKIVTDNNREVPYYHKLEFSIPAEVASINQLGRLLANWQVKINPEILWQAQTS